MLGFPAPKGRCLIQYNCMINAVAETGLIRVQALKEMVLTPIQGYKELAMASTKVYYDKMTNSVHVKYRNPPIHPQHGQIQEWYVFADYVKWID